MHKYCCTILHDTTCDSSTYFLLLHRFKSKHKGSVRNRLLGDDWRLKGSEVRGGSHSSGRVWPPSPRLFNLRRKRRRRKGGGGEQDMTRGDARF